VAAPGGCRLPLGYVLLGWFDVICLFPPITHSATAEPVFLLSHSHPDRPRPARGHHGTVCLHPPPRIHRRDSDHSNKRTRARIVARGRAPCDLYPAVFALSRRHGGSNSSDGAGGFRRLRRAGAMAASPGHLVRAKPRLGSVLQRRLADTPNFFWRSQSTQFFYVRFWPKADIAWSLNEPSFGRPDAGCRRA